MAMPTGTQDGPTTEIGATNLGMLPWGAFGSDINEKTPEWQWPISVQTVLVMDNDSQIQGLYYGATLPIRQYQWYIDPNGAPNAMVKKLQEDLNLPLKDELGEDAERSMGRAKRRFIFDRHLRLALRALAFGHAYFEQVGEIDEETFWRLRKLAERPQDTINEINVAPDGGLRWIRQALGVNVPPIPTDRLVAYVWEQEGSNWVGRSLYRALYKPWLIKDRVIRVGAINIQRAGGGFPVVTAPPDASPADEAKMLKIATNAKAGESSGAVIPFGSDFSLEGVRGIQPDAAGYVRLMNEEMARSWLMMFMQLGQTETGSRALGGEFIDYFDLAQQAIAKWFQGIFNEHVIEDWVDWNYGEDVSPVPRLAFEPGSSDEAVAPLKDAVDQGAVQVPETVANDIEASPGRSSLSRQRRTAAGEVAGISGLDLPPRPLRRQPYEHEVRAAVNYAEMDSAYDMARDRLVTDISILQRYQIEQLHDAIVDADGDLKKLAKLAADPISADVIQAELDKMATVGLNLAMDEASRQGVKLSRPGLSDVKSSLAKRAEAVDQLLASSLSETAGRKALQLTSETANPVDVARAVADHLSGLSNTYLGDQLGGALQAAMNAGRKVVINRGDPQYVYSSELLDSATCERCVSIDGTQYLSIEAAEGDYPTGGYADCLGGPRCRGTLVAVYEEV